MIRTVLKYLALVVLGIIVFLGANYLDDNPRVDISAPQPEQTLAWQETAETAEAAETTEADIPEATDAAEPETTELAQTETAPAGTAPEETEPGQQRFVLTLVGDCTLGGDPSFAHADRGFTPVVGEDYGYPFRNVLAQFEQDDFTLLNLECAMTDTGYPMGEIYSFRASESYVNILTENSVECVSLANNHTKDYGNTGYRRTRSVLETAGVPYVERDASRIITLDSGLTIGLYGAVYYDLNTTRIRREITALKDSGADVVIFVAHWGFEGNYKPRQQEIKLAHAAIDAGADIVYGTHPHVLQPVETYGDGVIFYSLANFCFGGNIYPKDMDTAMIRVEILREEDGSVRLGEWTAIPCSVSSEEDWNNYQPTPYAEGSEGYERVMSKLSGTWKIDHLNISK